ncbi:hypothetical protein RRG08_027732 [Elysia crispata]|uniref:Uncharacterized protein n=1 Tax=Elysia crispata TaxID=231223 RepID=A0AAE1CV62_9GAST|nr:hypothetical protein RRG08_027732 [Elysia crispata]
MDPFVLNKELFLLHSSLKARIFFYDGSKKELRSCDYGCKFEMELQKYMHNVKEDKQAAEIRINDTVFRCHSMLEEAFVQVEKRLPPSMEVFNWLKALNPQISKSFESSGQQYRRIHLVDWT